MNKEKLNIYTLWVSLDSNKDSYNLRQLNETNLWIFKNQENQFGFLITNTLGTFNYTYRNINVEWKSQLEDLKSKNKLKHCLVINSNTNIDSILFCSAFSTIFEGFENNHQFKISEIELALNKIEQITLKENYEFFEIIGAWGELYLLNFLITISNNPNSLVNLVNAWEGISSRSIIDFNFTSKKIKIEVKTTTENIRQHHFQNISQVTNESGVEGYLASLCISINESGKSNNELVENIYDKLPENLVLLFEEKLKLRGKVCFNDKFMFQLNELKPLEIYEFKNVPKPLLTDDITKVEWNSILEKTHSLNSNLKNDLLKYIAN
ncbi:PD-(D/E)XK motif protein [Aquirufa sp. OSTEICH-129V]|uniref:PD-(D/E)XK motif protein n=1 Tax=Aquirufa avitistagni TaxID=3104728 RepID=A0ABW6D8Z5_9BACT